MYNPEYDRTEKAGRTIRVIQINLNNCRDAQDLAMHTADKRKCDVMIISEPHRTERKANWVVSNDRKAAIVVLNPELVITRVKRGVGFAAADVNGTYVVSAYASPNERVERLKSCSTM